MPEYVQALEELLRGHKVAAVPEGSIVVGAVMLLKMMDCEGQSIWMSRGTADFGTVELIGAHVVEAERLKAEFLSGWRPDEDDE